MSNWVWIRSSSKSFTILRTHVPANPVLDVHIVKYICPNCKVHLSKLPNVFVKLVKHICPNGTFGIILSISISSGSSMWRAFVGWYGGFANLLIAFLQIFSQSKYILKFEQIQLSIWTNTIISLDKYNYQFRQIQCGGFGQLYWLYFCKTSPKANKNNVTPKHCWNICRALQCIVCQHYQFLKHRHRRNAINHHLFDYFNFFRFDH